MYNLYANKERLSGQGKGNNLFYGVALVTLLSIASSVVHFLYQSNQRTEEFLRKMENSKKLEYVVKNRETLWGLCSKEGLDAGQRNLCVGYVKQLNPQLKDRFVQSGERIIFPDISPNGKIGK